MFGFADILLVANRISLARSAQEPPPFDVEIVGVRRGEVTVAGGAVLHVDGPGRSDLLVVPAFDLAESSDSDSDTVLARRGPE